MIYAIYELRKWNENEEMIVKVNAIYAIAQRSLQKKIQDFNARLHLSIQKPTTNHQKITHSATLVIPNLG